MEVVNRIEKIQRRFVWSGTTDNQRIPLVRWDLCKVSKHNSGLGIVDIKSFNKAMLAKWLWRFASENNSWWKELINTKYSDSQSIWQSDRCKSGFSGLVWANITREYETFWKHVHIDPEGGAWVSFWKDCWIPNVTLAKAFPRVAAAASSPDAWVADIVTRTGQLLATNSKE
ncbi:unnamed protein product [Linum trigynum]|uniref:Uncharacterized protein n=1 Tax=Linum trigynum TaxID=586398 RepID=A0AAV2F3J6_9ROSI